MKHLFLTAFLAFALSARAESTDTLAPRLQKTAVTVHSESGQGSGTVVTRGGDNFCLTAGHVVAGNRVVDNIIEDSKEHPSVSFRPVTVAQEIYVDGQSVGTTTIEADVIAYSSSEYGQDLALLHLRSRITEDSATFSDKKLLPVGTELVHIGSLLGQEGSNSFTTGSLSQVGRVLNERVFDQSSCPSFPGSSGGSISLQSNGDYVGMLVRGTEGGFNLYIPIRRIRQWAATHHVEFVFDPKATPDLTKVRLEYREPTAPPDPAPNRPSYDIQLSGTRGS